MMKSKLFKGMEFVFKQIDTSKISGKSFLPIFINETLSQVYGDNPSKKVKEIVITPILKTKIEVAKGALLHLFRRCTIEYSEVTKAEI